MKKNKMLRMASSMLILTLLTISIIGGAFAKYTTTGTGTDTARVAKWGVKVSSEGNAFAKEYDTNVGGAITKSVVSADDKKLVAPGTSGNLLESSITGTPEVAVSVTTSADLTLTGWTINTDTGNETYCPIVIIIDDVEYKMGATANTANHVYDNTADFESAVETALNKKDNFKPNKNLGTAYNHEVTWAWAFAGAAADAYQTDEKDTALGNLNDAPTITFKYTATVTQID